MTVLVTGCRGAVARALVPLLQQAGIDVRAASSSAEAAVRCDLKDPATFPAALAGVRSVFLYAEAACIDQFVGQAVAAGVEHIVLLSSSSVLAPGAADDLLAKPHLDVENALRASPMRTTILRPGSFAGNATSWAWPIRSGNPVSLPFPGSYADPIHESDVAACAFAVLTEPGRSDGSYQLTGPESLTFSQQIDRIAEVLGRPVTVRPVSREAWKAEMARYLDGPHADALLDFWASTDGRPLPLTRTVAELTGHPPRSFTDWVHDHSTDFTA
jgi:uncharacterized protein YbjT (DUF2867 family)